MDEVNAENQSHTPSLDEDEGYAPLRWLRRQNAATPALQMLVGGNDEGEPQYVDVPTVDE